MLGRWNPQTVRLLTTEARYAGEITVGGRPHRAYSIMKGGKLIGSMRRAGANSGWFVNLVGFKFETIPGQGAARMGLKETDVKLFPNAPAARAAIKEAFSMIDINVQI